MKSLKIKRFIKQSIGVWKSMRSSHSLAFQQFEEVTSEIKIQNLSINDPEVISFLKVNNTNASSIISPFRIDWVSESNWESQNRESNQSGSTILIPIPISKEKGIMLRSAGYSEKVSSIAKYNFLSDDTFFITTKYEQTIAEERIWFISNNVRCRSSVIFSANSSAILQTAYSSEIRKLNL